MSSFGLTPLVRRDPLLPPEDTTAGPGGPPCCTTSTGRERCSTRWRPSA